MATDRHLKAVIELLRSLTVNGTMELGQKEAIEQGIFKLRRAYRSKNPANLRKAIDQVARIFLRTHGR